ncbi:shikimate kinase [Candidatus Woesearchaeota archaeon]|nr:shikimate kinase [Candidatus Woesearchaeota archaeon]
MNSVVLIGARCSGKTSVGRELSSMLNVPFVDADTEFIQANGEIRDFVDKHGWEEFRRAETEIIEDICARYHGIVFAPGGGAVGHNQGEKYRQRNVELLREFGLVVYLLPYPDLRQSAEILTRRIENDANSVSTRPSLTGNSDSVTEMLLILEQRHSFYLAASHHQIYTGEKLPVEIARDVIRIYKKVR